MAVHDWLFHLRVHEALDTSGRNGSSGFCLLYIHTLQRRCLEVSPVGSGRDRGCHVCCCCGGFFFFFLSAHPVAASQVRSSATEPCITAQLSFCSKRKKKSKQANKQLPLSLNQKPKTHLSCSFSLSFSLSLFAACEALLPGQRNLSDSEKHSRETRPPADQGDTLFILPSFLPLPLLPA